MHRQLGDGPVAPDCRHRHLRLERRTVLLSSLLHLLLPRYPRFLGAGLHLSHLSHFRGPAHQASMWNAGTCRSDAKGEIQIGGPYEGESTDAGHRGGATRSSDEGPVMGLERRGCVVLLWPEGNWQREDPHG